MVDLDACSAPRMSLLGRRRIAGEIWVPSWAMDTMIQEAERWEPHETGGALVGYEIKGGFVITDLVDAGPEAVREASAFTPDADYQLCEIGRLYAASGRLHTYIGDWHTHPAGSPAYSRVDLRAMKTVARSAESRCAFPLMLIVGGKDSWELIAWRYQARPWWAPVTAVPIRQY
jgi:integrative and conjugative element protein (TIGR02256 family)